jgi:ATP-binding cassette subfamily F protein 3
MFDPTTAEPWLAKLGMSDLMKRRAEVAAKLEVAEAAWLQVSEELETVEA